MNLIYGIGFSDAALKRLVDSPHEQEIDCPGMGCIIRQLAQALIDARRENALFRSALVQIADLEGPCSLAAEALGLNR